MDKKFKILNIEHIAIAVKDISSSKAIFEDVLGMHSSDIETVENEKVEVVKLSASDSTSKIELVKPTDSLSPISKFIDKRGQGIHHIALEVDNIYNAVEYLKFKGIKLVYNSPRKGADDKLITFIHPSSSPGILIEICQNN